MTCLLRCCLPIGRHQGAGAAAGKRQCGGLTAHRPGGRRPAWRPLARSPGVLGEGRELLLLSASACRRRGFDLTHPRPNVPGREPHPLDPSSWTRSHPDPDDSLYDPEGLRLAPIRDWPPARRRPVRPACCLWTTNGIEGMTAHTLGSPVWGRHSRGGGTWGAMTGPGLRRTCWALVDPPDRLPIFARCV